MSTTDINVPLGNDSKPKSGLWMTHSSISKNSPSEQTVQVDAVEGSEEISEIFNDIFEPCLRYRDGNIFSEAAIKQEAAVLADTIRSLSLIELPYTEMGIIKDFLEHYRTKLEVFSAGPGPSKNKRIAKDSLVEDFYRKSLSVLTALELQLQNIETESKLAFKIHEEQIDIQMNRNLPQVKRKVNVSTGEIAVYLTQLDALSNTNKEPPSPKTTGQKTNTLSRAFDRILGNAS